MPVGRWCSHRRRAVGHGLVLPDGLAHAGALVSGGLSLRYQHLDGGVVVLEAGNLQLAFQSEVGVRLVRVLRPEFVAGVATFFPWQASMTSAARGMPRPAYPAEAGSGRRRRATVQRLCSVRCSSSASSAASRSAAATLTMSRKVSTAGAPLRAENSRACLQES